MTRFLPARHYIYFGLGALVFGLFSAWIGLTMWAPAYVAAALFLASAALLLALAFRPVIEVQDPFLRIGDMMIPWIDIRRIDRTGWVSPLAVRLTLFDDTRVMLVYAGDVDACKSLLRTLRRMSRDALIDGIPYRQYWGEMLAAPLNDRRPPPPRYRVLRPEDEIEIERLYQRLKTVGHLDSKNAGDEK